MILETRAWRDRLFAQREAAGRADRPREDLQPGWRRPGMMGGGQLALNQLLVVMDGIDNPPFFRRLFTNWTNTFLDATYIIPARMGRFSCVCRGRSRGRTRSISSAPRTSRSASSIPRSRARGGWAARLAADAHEDRPQGHFDLYISKVDHEGELDTEQKRDELARITGGYSPAMIEQVCSMALTYAHADGRERFDSADILEAMTTVESGTAVNIEYPEEDTRAVALHESGQRRQATST